MFDYQIIKAAAYVGQKIYSTPYTRTEGSFFQANFYYQCADGTIIYRPNHNIANALRRLIYCQPVIDYYTIHANNDLKEQFALINEDEAEKAKIHFILLFYTSGRENEQNSSETHSKPKVSAILEEYFSTCPSFSPFKDLAELKYYASLILSKSKPTEAKDKAIALLFQSCHELDLLRCFPGYKLKNSLFKTFNENSQQKNTRNLRSLVFYAQNCILANGDKLRTRYQAQSLHGDYHRQGFHLHLKSSRLKLIKSGNNAIVFGVKGYDDTRFKAATRVDENEITSTLRNLAQVPKPVFFKNVKTETPCTAEKALALIEKGDAAVRIINGSPHAISLRFEFEQLRNPHFMRPLRKRKLIIPHRKYYDLVTGQTSIRPEKDYIEFSQQVAIQSLQDLPAYVSDKPISRQADRGKPKNTIFTKKQSYSLLPKDGIFPIFGGRLEYRINPSFISVGTLYDLEKMHKKGERYIWSEDVRSSGIGGYFWLLDETGSASAIQGNRIDRLSISELKEKLQSEAIHKFNELLLGASLDSLQALFATKDNRLYRLSVLHANAILSRDYGVTRPLLIITGKSKPKEYTPHQIEADLTRAIKKYRQWYWRLFHFFFSSKEQQVLLEIIGLVSSQGLGVKRDELIQYFDAKTEFSSTQSVQVSEVQSRIVKEEEQTELANTATFDSGPISTSQLVSGGLFKAKGKADDREEPRSSSLSSLTNA
jgi:hypothetical protein